MSLLMNALRTVMAVRNQAAATQALPPAMQQQDPQAGPASAPAGTAPGPVWRLLDDRIGVQDLSYGEHPREGVREFFAHPPRRLLDIGCATGAVAAGMKQAFPGLWAWGCELNPQAAQVAAGRLDHVTPAPREQWSADDLARVATVDTVLLLDVLEHMYNPWAELAFLSERLRPDAQVVVTLPNVGNIDILQDLARGHFAYDAMGILDVTHVRFFTYEGMQAMFEETGFAIEAAAIVSQSAMPAPIERFPARVSLGKMTLEVDTEEEWARLHATQFGFRLRPRRAA
ncbi:class I SAM-dependent methyltransferase [Ramlibacter sp. USB13]|uniref:Class I SAM-dependent methyltransferase n=1 Tax=Ramlibacter cellulosilyticus TaxID=2764187 RepID=A0A923MQK2_9BURK|nr:class I SAM-dependent methyltransferase [Ramlibacter cellulosilyticus]MBC5783061.1 class I SAM-dependent methyltransferase [Ramlibacter cellulosilyticus]